MKDIPNTIYHDDKNLYCPVCGSRSPKKAVWLWFPIVLRIRKRDWKKYKKPSSWGWQVGYSTFGRFVFQRIVRWLCFVFVFGRDDFVGHMYDRELRVWLQPEDVQKRKREFLPYEQFLKSKLHFDVDGTSLVSKEE